jgi:hypothetical protein
VRRRPTGLEPISSRDLTTPRPGVERTHSLMVSASGKVTRSSLLFFPGRIGISDADPTSRASIRVQQISRRSIERGTPRISPRNSWGPSVIRGDERHTTASLISRWVKGHLLLPISCPAEAQELAEAVAITRIYDSPRGWIQIAIGCSSPRIVCGACAISG